MSDIRWPEAYLPGMTDNYVSNEVIVAGLSVAEVWPWLVKPSRWPDYYDNAAEVRLYPPGAGELGLGMRFRFTTFGFPVEAEVNEFELPAPGRAACVAWHGWVEGDAADRLDVHHAWLLEDLPGGRVRILTQETQNGAPAKTLAAATPNPMLNAHQAWLDGLVRAARAAKA